MPAKPTATTPAYEAEVEYNVRLMKPLVSDGIQFLPRHEHTMKGDFLNRLIAENGPDAIDTASPVAG